MFFFLLVGLSAGLSIGKISFSIAFSSFLKSTAKYLYDVSKGTALLAVIGNIVQGKWELLVILLGIVTPIIFYIDAYILEGMENNE